jgi:hypothetical protein
MTNRELNTMMHRQLNTLMHRGLNTDACRMTRARTRHVLLPTANRHTPREQRSKGRHESKISLARSLARSLSALLVDPGLRVRVPLRNALLEPKSDFALRRLNLCVYLVTSAYVGIRLHTSAHVSVRQQSPTWRCAVSTYAYACSLTNVAMRP